MSEACEAAIRRLNYTLAQHRRTQESLDAASPVSGRLSVSPAGAAASMVRAESTLVRIVAIAEAFCFGQLAWHMESKAPHPRGDLLDALYLAAEERATANWAQAEQAYGKWANVKLNKQGETWHEFLAVVEARNAVIHGLGQFTNRQRRAGNFGETRARLQRLGYRVTPTQVRVTPTSLQASADLGVQVIKWVDAKMMPLGHP